MRVKRLAPELLWAANCAMEEFRHPRSIRDALKNQRAQQQTEQQQQASLAGVPAARKAPRFVVVAGILLLAVAAAVLAFVLFSR